MDNPFELTVEQGSEEWLKQRLGKFTSSRFSDLLTSSRTKGEVFGQTAKTYISEVAAEILTGEQVSNFVNQAMEWGTYQEDFAREAYEEITGNSVVESPFIEMNNYCGGSPDGLIDEDGIIEIKCPYNSTNFINSVVNDSAYDKKHVTQMQGYLMITGRKWCDYVCFDPRIKGNNIHVVRYERDEELISKIRERVELGKKELDIILEKVGWNGK
jgi:predicted phage-related endonuclease